MVSFADLPEIDRWALVAYLRSLSPVPKESEAPTEIAWPAVPERLESPRQIEVGEKAYTRLACVTCHGARGRGDGPAALGLSDFQGRPIRPRDFVTQPFKRGPQPGAIYTTLVTGLNGTPMPSFAAQADEDELWSLVAYVRSLSREGLKKVDPTDLAEARRVVAQQQGQGQHATQGGCGCNARRPAR